MASRLREELKAHERRVRRRQTLVALFVVLVVIPGAVAIAGGIWYILNQFVE